MVYARKSVSKMATAAAASANECLSDGGKIDTTAVNAAAAAVHAATPDDAPARAANAASDAGAEGDVCTAIAAGVAAAAVGKELDAIRKISKAAFDGFRSSKGADPADVAENVAKYVNAVTSRHPDASSLYPAVEAAAAAAYAAYAAFQNLKAQGGVVDGAAIVAAGGAVDDAAHAAVGDAADGPAADGAVADGAAADCAAADGAAADGAAAGDAAAVDVASGAVVGGADIAPADAREDVNGAAIAAGKAAGAAAILGPGHLSYGAAAAARAATFVRAGDRSVVAGAVEAADSTGAYPLVGTAQHEERVAAAIAASAPFGAASASSVVTCGAEQLEALSHNHHRIYRGLQTIMTLDIFLAGFLLNTLTGKWEEEVLSEREVAQIILQTASFVVLLAATVYAGTLMLLTGGKYSLSQVDMIVTIALSVAGLGLVLVTVGNSIYLALGLSSDHNSKTLTLYYVFTILGLLIPAYAAIFVAYLTKWFSPQGTRSHT